MNSRPIATPSARIDVTEPGDADLAALISSGDRSAVVALANRYVGAVHALIARSVLDRAEVARLTRASMVDALVDVLLEPTSYWTGSTGLDDLDGAMRVRVTFFRSAIERLSSLSGPAAPAEMLPEGADTNTTDLARTDIVVIATRTLDWEDRLLLDLSEREGLSESGLSRAIGLTPAQTRGRVELARSRLAEAVSIVADIDIQWDSDLAALYASAPIPDVPDDVWQSIWRDLAARWPEPEEVVQEPAKGLTSAAARQPGGEARVEYVATVSDKVSDSVDVGPVANNVSDSANVAPVPAVAPDFGDLAVPTEAWITATRFRTFQGLRAAADGPTGKIRSRWGTGAGRSDPPARPVSRQTEPSDRSNRHLLVENTPHVSSPGAAPPADPGADRTAMNESPASRAETGIGQSSKQEEPNTAAPSPVYRTRAADALLRRTQAAVLSLDDTTEPVPRQTQLHVNSEALAPYSRPIRLRTASVGRMRWAALIVLLLLLGVIVGRMIDVLVLPGIGIPFLGAATGVSVDSTRVPSTATSVSTSNATAKDVESLATMKGASPIAASSTSGDGFAASSFVLAMATSLSVTPLPPTSTVVSPTNTSVPPTATLPPTNTTVPPTPVPAQSTAAPPPPRQVVNPPPVAPAPVYQPPVFQPPPPTPIPIPPTATQAPPTEIPIPPTLVPTTPPPPTVPPEPTAAPTRGAVVLVGITATPRFPPPR